MFRQNLLSQATLSRHYIGPSLFEAGGPRFPTPHAQPESAKTF